LYDHYISNVPYSTLRRAASSYHGLYRFLNGDFNSFGNWEVQLGLYLSDYDARHVSTENAMSTLYGFVVDYI